MGIKSNVQPIIWKESKLHLLDQRILPYEVKYLEMSSYKEVINAIKDMVLRGAPLIGITAGYGLLLAAQEFHKDAYHGIDMQRKLRQVGEEIKKARPTAINLQWAVDLILGGINKLDNTDEIVSSIEERAKWIHNDDQNRCLKIGTNGSKLISDGFGILTICNTGALATGGIGTAFGIVHTAANNYSGIKVYAAETRPRQQGARLTTFEAAENGIDCTLISDTACGYIMQKGLVNIVIAGADRIAANGDTANKIGTYQLAVLAKENNIPFYIAAPLSTFDLRVKNGEEIPIEEREESEVTEINGKRICSESVKAKNPAFDVTPAKYIAGIVTEKGVLKGNLTTSINEAFNEAVTA